MLVDATIWTDAVLLLKYTLLVGASLFAIIAVAAQIIEPAPVSASKPASMSSSLEVLRKMANHGEAKPFASAAVTGPFLPMPMAAAPLIAAVMPEAKPATIAAASIMTPLRATPQSALEAQARLEETVIAEKPARPAKKATARKPKPRASVDYVENVQRGPGGFFGAFQSW